MFNSYYENQLDHASVENIHPIIFRLQWSKFIPIFSPQERKNPTLALGLQIHDT